MSHMKKVIIDIPELREDEKNFRDDHDSPITARHLVVTVNGTSLVDVVLGLDQPVYTLAHIPAGSIVQADISDVAEDGHEGRPNSTSAQAPVPPKIIPVPDAVTISFEDEEDE